jgi:hypothetical protein
MKKQATGNGQQAAGRVGLALALMLAIGVMLGGCAGQDIPDGWVSLIEAEQAQPPAPPAECSTKGDPKWRIPPKGDETMADTARRERQNKTAFEELQDRRRVCAAGQVAKLDSAPAPPSTSAKQ